MSRMGILGLHQLWHHRQSTSTAIYGEMINNTEGQLSGSIVTVRSIWEPCAVAQEGRSLRKQRVGLDWRKAYLWRDLSLRTKKESENTVPVSTHGSGNSMPDGGTVQRCWGRAFTRAPLAVTQHKDLQLRAQPSYSLCCSYFTHLLLIAPFHRKTRSRDVIPLLETSLQKPAESNLELI